MNNRTVYLSAYARPCKCGTIPVPGDIFRYVSPYGADYESVVKTIEGSGVISVTNVRYSYSDIIIITKIKEREKKLNKIL